MIEHLDSVGEVLAGWEAENAALSKLFPSSSSPGVGGLGPLPPMAQAGPAEGGPGLSIAHISTSPSLIFYQGGRLVELKGLKYPPLRNSRRGKRGLIVEFSRQSKWRLLQYLCRINFDRCSRPDFVSLTYPKDYSLDWHIWKKHLNHIIISFQRRWPQVWGIWRLEFQHRGAPEVHLLLFDGPEVEGYEKVNKAKSLKLHKIITEIKPRNTEKNMEIYRWLARTWYEIVDSGDENHLKAGTQIAPIMSINGVIYYVSKYLGKELKDGGKIPVEYTGRFWGVIGKKYWKVDKFDEELPPAVFYMIRRVLVKMYRKRGGKRNKHIDGRTDVTTIIDSNYVVQLLRWAYGEMPDRMEKIRAPSMARLEQAERRKAFGCASR